MRKRRLEKAEADYLVLGIAYGAAMDVYNIVCGLPVENSNRVDELTREVNEAFADVAQDDAEEIAPHEVQQAYDKIVFAARWYNHCLPREQRIPDASIRDSLGRH